MSHVNHPILLLEQFSTDENQLRSLLSQLQCSVTVVRSIEQAVLNLSRILPCLVILNSNDLDWVQASAQQIRPFRHTSPMTLVALTDPDSPNWQWAARLPGIDGYLIKPLDRSVLRTVLRAALARQSCQPLSQASDPGPSNVFFPVGSEL
jgi:DNA-binding response OmpR family regulator